MKNQRQNAQQQEQQQPPHVDQLRGEKLQQNKQPLQQFLSEPQKQQEEVQQEESLRLNLMGRNLPQLIVPNQQQLIGTLRGSHQPLKGEPSKCLL